MMTVIPHDEDNKNLDWELAVQEKQENVEVDVERKIENEIKEKIIVEEQVKKLEELNKIVEKEREDNEKRI
ncbi:MAG: hypothetical protein IPK55_12950 [Streptococcus sp.]|nr:hypothetical protein [Streptococcus sp.]